MRSASAQFVERDFRRLGFYNSSDFSSLGVGVEDFADYFANVPVPSVQIPTALEHIGGVSFCHIDPAGCFSAFKSITSNAVGADGISVKFFKLLLPLICCHVLHVFNHAIISSVFLLCERWLLFGRLLRLVLVQLPVLLTFAPLVLFLFYLRRLNPFSVIRCWSMSIVAICCRIFSLVSDVGTALRLILRES
jgi:hypothetical protein